MATNDVSQYETPRKFFFSFFRGFAKVFVYLAKDVAKNTYWYRCILLYIYICTYLICGIRSTRSWEMGLPFRYGILDYPWYIYIYIYIYIYTKEQVKLPPSLWRIQSGDAGFFWIHWIYRNDLQKSFWEVSLYFPIIYIYIFPIIYIYLYTDIYIYVHIYINILITIEGMAFWSLRMVPLMFMEEECN